MAPRGRGGRGGGKGAAPSGGQALTLVAWGLGLLSIGSAFAPLAPDFLRTLHWLLFLFAILEAGMSLGQGRRTAFLVNAAVAVLVNPFSPFFFALQIWRMLHAGIGLWWLAEHMPRRD